MGPSFLNGFCMPVGARSKGAFWFWRKQDGGTAILVMHDPCLRKALFHLLDNGDGEAAAFFMQMCFAGGYGSFAFRLIAVELNADGECKIKKQDM